MYCQGWLIEHAVVQSSMYIASLSNTAIDHPSEMTRGWSQAPWACFALPYQPVPKLSQAFQPGWFLLSLTQVLSPLEQRIAHLLPFFETDTISFREPVNEVLMEHQALRWDPFADWFKQVKIDHASMQVAANQPVA